ncbi:hypothetical protein [Nocardiopsis halophila]|uniref:hypothetical protein n=1 Tax=Nocardiopsis halophila TaxID=141692 RepID=UPI00034A9661|nr:hypothetical protein [Nocardiopsis halophila]
MDTAAAAAQAGVTVPTIRTWCRIGAVAAVKTAGRWIVSAASLARRIRFGCKETTVDTTPRYRCGHPVQPTRRNPDPEARPRRDCRPCKDQRRADAHAALRLPGIQGTPKEVARAADIRTQWLDDALTTTLAGDLVLGEGMGYETADLGTWASAEQAAEDITRLLADRTEAAWWIQHRGHIGAALRARA